MSDLRIAVLTGKRGGFGAMKPLLRLITESNKMDLQLLVTDQHVNEKFGNTVKEIDEEFHVSAVIDMKQLDSEPLSRVKALGRCLNGMANIFNDLKPDVLILYGDRGEVLTTAIVATHFRVPIIHLQGGDISGNIDENIRHALTKLSHFHFTSCEESYERVLKMGEEPWRVYISGDNHIDLIVQKEYTKLSRLKDKYSLNDNGYIIFLLHPETTRNRDGYKDTSIVLKCLERTKKQIITIYPCSDHGFQPIIDAINDYKNNPNFLIHKNIVTKDFLGLMKNADLFIGNSSAGLIETSYFNLPTINIGNRQLSRKRPENVINCDFDEERILTSIDKSLHDTEFKNKVKQCSKQFGNGKAGEIIYQSLERINFKDKKILDKKFIN